MRDLTILDRQQRILAIKYPTADKICTTCARPHALDDGSLLYGQLRPMIADVDHRLNERIVQIERSLSRVTEDTITQVEVSLSKMKNETITDLSALADSAEKRANQYGLRLALAGMNFILIYLLVPNIQRWQALEFAHRTFTVGGLLLASIWIGTWIRRSVSDPESRGATLLLIAAGTIVLIAKFVFGT